jgi:hypothetical protein|tara:strand:+ start:5019 stop:5189 length:171 start_codon:yes stop_codon:yes gene_type:complete
MEIVIKTSKKKKGGGSKKIGRNMEKCKKYRSEGRREKNQKRRARRIEKGFQKKEAA